MFGSGQGQVAGLYEFRTDVSDSMRDGETWPAEQLLILIMKLWCTKLLSCRKYGDTVNLPYNFTYYINCCFFPPSCFGEIYISEAVTFAICKWLLQTVIRCCTISYCCRIYVILLTVNYL
jgi:hypothetical protein